MVLDRMIDLQTMEDIEALKMRLLNQSGDIAHTLWKILSEAGHKQLTSNYINYEPEDELKCRLGDAFAFQVLMENVDDYLSDIQQLSEQNESRMKVLREIINETI